MKDVSSPASFQAIRLASSIIVLEGGLLLSSHRAGGSIWREKMGLELSPRLYQFF